MGYCMATLRYWTGQKAAHSAVVDDFPVFSMTHKMLAQAFEYRQVVKTTQLIPRLDGKPVSGVNVGIVQADSSCQEEAPLILTHLFPVFQDVDTQQEGEQQL